MFSKGYSGLTWSKKSKSASFRLLLRFWLQSPTKAAVKLPHRLPTAQPQVSQPMGRPQPGSLDAYAHRGWISV